MEKERVLFFCRPEKVLGLRNRNRAKRDRHYCLGVAFVSLVAWLLVESKNKGINHPGPQREHTLSLEQMQTGHEEAGQAVPLVVLALSFCSLGGMLGATAWEKGYQGMHSQLNG